MSRAPRRSAVGSVVNAQRCPRRVGQPKAVHAAALSTAAKRQLHVPSPTVGRMPAERRSPGWRDITMPLTMTVELVAVTIGDRPLFDGPAPVQAQVDGNVIRFSRGDSLREEFVARDEGVEQRWWIEEDPGLEGALVVTVEVETALELSYAEGGEGFVFRAVDERTGVMREVASYERALALDAGGRAKRAQFWAEEIESREPGVYRYRLAMRFPAEWMAGAQYPLLIDPLIGNRTLLHIQQGSQSLPAVAYNSTLDEYLVVWQDNRDDNNNIHG